MTRLEDHPTVVAIQAKNISSRPVSLDALELRRLCLEAGAADVGFVGLNRSEMDLCLCALGELP